jgi:hypothetical protein
MIFVNAFDILAEGLGEQASIEVIRQKGALSCDSNMLELDERSCAVLTTLDSLLLAARG